MDDDLAEFITRMVTSPDFSSTVITIMGDHGGTVNKVTMEKRYPMEKFVKPAYYTLIPNSLLKEKPFIKENMIHNEDKLLTNFDVYTTISSLPELSLINKPTQAEKTKYLHPWTYNLFTSKVPEDRLCKDAGIPPFYCVNTILDDRVDTIFEEAYNETHNYCYH